VAAAALPHNGPPQHPGPGQVLPAPTGRRRGSWVTPIYPWVVAGRIYGPYGVSALKAKFKKGEFDAQARINLADGVVMRVSLDPLLRILVPVRLWLSLGVIIVLVKLLSRPDLASTIQDVATHGLITMVVGPYGVLIGVVVLIVAAGRGQRPTMVRQMMRPALIAVLTVLVSVGIFGLQLPMVRQAIGGAMNALSPAQLLARLTLPLQIVLPLLSSVVGLWLLIFGVCGVYLMHRNGFSVNSHPLLRPIVTVWLSWTIAATQFTIGDKAGLAHAVFIAAVVSGPALVTLIGVVETIRLRRLGVSLRAVSSRAAQFPSE
jgi:hypothetical protein